MKAKINIEPIRLPRIKFCDIAEGHFFIYHLNDEYPNMLMQKVYLYNHTNCKEEYALRVSDGYLIRFKGLENVTPLESINIDAKFNRG